MGDLNEYLGDDGFDPNAHEAASDFEPIPAGDYPVMIEEAEVKATKAKDGAYLKMMFVILGDNFAGRKLFANINLKNKSEKCVEIGIRELAALGQAVGLAKITDSQELVGQSLIVRVSVRPADENNRAKNEVKAYKSLTGDAPKRPATAPQSAPSAPVATNKKPATAGTGVKPPWAR